MPAETFDWRDDPMGTVLAVPEVRARFIRVEPGKPRGTFHTHYDHQGNRQPTTPVVTHPTWKGELAMGVTR